MPVNAEEVARFCATAWAERITPALHDYIRIPNVSPAFDEGWEAAGHMDRAVALARAWCEDRAVPGLQVEVVQLPGRTPVLLLELAATPAVAAADPDATVLLYGHLDKQPPMTEGWRPGLHPWEPVVVDGRLYGRGGADDGYAVFASLTAIEAVRDAGGDHARCVVLIECSEESGSPDLPAYIEHLAARIGTPGLVVCLDSFCGSYDRLWATTSLRGMMTGHLRVDVLTEGVHSGSASGMVPSSFRILRELLDRIEDARTGEVLLPELHVAIPEQRRAEIAAVAAETGEALPHLFPLAGGTRPMGTDPVEHLLARTWRPTICYIGADGLPPSSDAGNVLRPWTQLALSFRLPPTCSSATATAALTRVLETDPPSGAQVSFTMPEASDGWAAPATAPWLAAAMEEASTSFWGQSPRSMGEGGSIPFMAMLGQRFPEAQFLITGVLGPGSNAHGPNEFLDLATGERVTATTALALAAQASAVSD